MWWQLQDLRLRLAAPLVLMRGVIVFRIPPALAHVVAQAPLAFVLVAATATTSLAADVAGTPASQASTATAKGNSPDVPHDVSLAEILTAIVAQDASERAIRAHLPGPARFDALAAAIEADETRFAKTGRVGFGPSDGVLEYFALLDLSAEIHTLDRRLGAAIDEVVATAKTLDADLDRLARYDREALTWLAAARARNAPVAVLERIEALPERHLALEHELQASRDLVLDLLTRATRLRDAMAVRFAEAADRRSGIEVRMRSAQEVPLWRTTPMPGGIGNVVQNAQAGLHVVAEYLRANAIRLLAVALTAFAVGLLLMATSRKRLAQASEIDLDARRTRGLFEAPVTAALLLTMLALIRFGPTGPAFYYDLLWSAIPIAAALLARDFAPLESLSLITLAAALVSAALLGPILDPLPLSSRVLLIAQCVAVAGALAVDLRRRNLVQPESPHPVLTRRAAKAMIVLLLLAVAASVLGYVGASRILRNAVLGALGIGLVVIIARFLLYGFAVALLQTETARRLRIVRLHLESIRRTVRVGLAILAWIVWAAGMLLLLGRLDGTVRFAQRVVDATIEIGAVGIPMAGILTGLAVVAGTFVVIKVVRLLLDVEILPRLPIKQGVAFAVSTLIRYGLITAGVLLAMAAMGIDLTKVTVLAGALGVGIGFGLQSVINNFVCGLILLTERPISAGDEMQMGNLQGTVESIGVRSTTIRTPQGADVIVPNADLISKVVSNWTLSDRRRRLEIDVGVARETEPEAVMQLLEAAAKEIDGVAPAPAPRAWLTGFREKARDYRLHAWVYEFDRALAVQSELRVAIARRLEAASFRSA
jgi:small-conductance mechanosensitive channel